jgi:glycerol transport system ATP-binding protein
MNFLECTLEGNVARCNGARIALDGAVSAQGQEVQGKIELGIRPMHLELYGEAVDGGVPTQVKSVEDQGSYRIVNVTLDGHTIRVRVPEGASNPRARPSPRTAPGLYFPRSGSGSSPTAD